MDGVIAAFVATGLYYIGFSIYKVAADRMEPLRGSRPFRIVVVVLTHPLWLLGLGVVLMGLVLQIVALSTVPIGVATPIFVSGLIPILIIAVAVFGERLTAREWLSLALIAAAMLLVALSVGRTPLSKTPPPDWKIIAIAIPALALPYLLVALGDHRPDGRHARPVSGLAYGITAGLPLGTAELAIRGLADHRRDGLAILGTPYPYVTVVTAALSFGILMLGFQRCRVSIVITVATIVAKTHLLLMGTVLYGEPWPDDAGNATLRVGGLLLAGVALFLFPHYDPIAEGTEGTGGTDGTEDARGDENGAPGRDAAGRPGDAGGRIDGHIHGDGGIDADRTRRTEGSGRTAGRPPAAPAAGPAQRRTEPVLAAPHTTPPAPRPAAPRPAAPRPAAPGPATPTKPGDHADPGARRGSGDTGAESAGPPKEPAAPPPWPLR